MNVTLQEIDLSESPGPRCVLEVDGQLRRYGIEVIRCGDMTVTGTESKMSEDFNRFVWIPDLISRLAAKMLDGFQPALPMVLMVNGRRA